MVIICVQTFGLVLYIGVINNQIKKHMKFINNWYPVILAFICLIYSVTYGILGRYEEAQYSAHWPGTILLFAIAIRQRRKKVFFSYNTLAILF